MKRKYFIACLFGMHYFFVHAQITLRDAFGRDLSGHAINLVDWEGYMANPAIKLTIESSYFPGWVTIESFNGDGRLYLNQSSVSTAAGPQKTIFVIPGSPAEFYLSIFPDRDGEDEDYVLTLQTGFGPLTYPIHVIDQDSDVSTIEFNINIDYSYDKPAYNFFADQNRRNIVRQAADDWAFFIQDMKLDTIKTNTQSSYIWDDDFTSTRSMPNSTAYSGFLLYAYGFHCAPHRSGGEGQGVFQTINGVQTALRSVGGYEAEVHGNYNALGYGTYTDETWFAATNYPDTQNDLYSVAMHEIGHAIGLNRAYPMFSTYKAKGYIDDPDVVAYQGTTVPVDASDHLVDGTGDITKNIDRITKKGSFGNDYAQFMPHGRWLITKLNLLVLKAIGYKLKTTSAFKETTIINPLLANGTLGQNYSASILADGGIPFYKFEVSSGILPPGLVMDSFSGRISGTATQPGTFTFTARVTDYDNKFADRTFTMDVLAALPVKLVSFSVSRNNCNAFALRWKTTSEENNKGFDVEQSTDGTNFHKIGFVAANSPAGTSPSYSFTGTELIEGTTFFRLKQIDHDNQLYYSPVVTIQNTCSNSPITVSPNPVSAWLHIKGLPSGANTVKLVDVSGRTVAHWSKTTQKDFDINYISKGIYFLLINETTKFKIVKE